MGRFSWAKGFDIRGPTHIASEVPDHKFVGNVCIGTTVPTEDVPFLRQDSLATDGSYDSVDDLVRTRYDASICCSRAPKAAYDEVDEPFVPPISHSQMSELLLEVKEHAVKAIGGAKVAARKLRKRLSICRAQRGNRVMPVHKNSPWSKMASRSSPCQSKP